jgi:hypothetical protein
VPVGREALHAREGLLGDIRHDLERERDDRLETDQPQHHGRRAERHDGAERDQRRTARVGIGRTARQRIDQMSGEYRHEQVGDGCAQQAAGHDQAASGLLQPVPEYEGQHHAYRRRLF